MQADSKRKDQAAQRLKIVTVRIPGIAVLEREPCLLFTASQVEEVLPKVKVQPLPFAAEWLLGLCLWRQQMLPVVNIVQLYGMQSSFTDQTARYIVVRTAIPSENTTKELQEQGKEIFRCILKVPDHIATGAIPEQCTSVTAEQAGIKGSLARGIFEHEDGLLIVPDLVPVTCQDA